MVIFINFYKQAFSFFTYSRSSLCIYVMFYINFASYCHSEPFNVRVNFIINSTGFQVYYILQLEVISLPVFILICFCFLQSDDMNQYLIIMLIWGEGSEPLTLPLCSGFLIHQHAIFRSLATTYFSFLRFQFKYFDYVCPCVSRHVKGVQMSSEARSRRSIPWQWSHSHL